MNSSDSSSDSSNVKNTALAPTQTGLASLLSPVLPTSSASTSPIQSATSPRLMPAKSRPTTALVFDQRSDTQQARHQCYNQQQYRHSSQQDTESLSSDEFVLSPPSIAVKENNLKEINLNQPVTRPLKGLAITPSHMVHGEHSRQDGDSESSDDVDGRLTDTDNEQDPEYDRTGIPILARQSQARVAGSDRSTTATITTALQSLREIDEHDREDRQSLGIGSRFRTAATLTTDQDHSSEGGDSTTGSDPNPESTLDANQIQDKLKVLRPKHSNSNNRPKSHLQRTASNKSYDSDDISNNHGGYKKHSANEDHTTTAWTSHRKHFFILSSAGKPIYARYGDESRISSYMGVIQALISFFADNDDSLRCINAGQHKFVFLLKSPLYLVCVSRSGESESQLRDQLGYLYAQIISVLTHSQMTRIFEQRNNFDLRGLIGGTEIFLDSLGKLMNTYSGFMLGAIQCLTIPRELRDRVGAVLGRAKCKPLLYAILLTPTQLITLLRPRTHSMHPSDLHLIFNLLSGSTTFESSESWTPICLPKFNNKSFLHAYICYIAKRVCMLLISPDKDSFFEMSNVKQKVVQELEAGGMLASLESFAAAGTRGGFAVGDTGIPGLRHFLYKSRTNVQYTMPELNDLYTSLSSKKRLLRQYQHMNERMHRKSRQLKLLFHVGEHETMLGWITSSFELYAVFGPLVSKSAVVLMSNKLLKWIRRQEDNLLILNSPSFEKFK